MRKVKIPSLLVSFLIDYTHENGRRTFVCTALRIKYTNKRRENCCSNDACETIATFEKAKTFLSRRLSLDSQRGNARFRCSSLQNISQLWGGKVGNDKSTKQHLKFRRKAIVAKLHKAKPFSIFLFRIRPFPSLLHSSNPSNLLNFIQLSFDNSPSQERE